MFLFCDHFDVIICGVRGLQRLRGNEAVQIHHKRIEDIHVKLKEKRTPLLWICKNSGRYLWAVGLLAVVSAVISGSFLLLALVSRQVLDIATGAAKGSVIVCAAELCGIIGLQAVLNILNANLRIRVLTKLEMWLRQTIFAGVLKKQYAEIRQMHSGEILNRFTSDIDIIVNGIINLFPQLVAMMTQLVGGMLVLFSVDRRFMLLILAIGILVLAGSRLCSGKFRYLHKEVQRTNGKVRSFLQECIENVVVIKSFVNETPVLGRLAEYQKENYEIRKKRTAVSNVANTAVYVVFSAGYYAALVWGALQIAAGQMTVGTVAALLQIVNQIKSPFRSMSGLLTQYYSMIASAERIMELEELKDEEKQTTEVDTKALYNRMKSIRLEHATFAYHEGEPVLLDASLTIEKGEFVAIVGPSGAGKSTLFKLLLHLARLQEGSLKLELESESQDKEHAEDIACSLDAGTRGLFAYVPQGNLILSGTIRENLLFGNADVTEEEMRQAARSACIEKVIEEFPEGYDTVLGERGIGLSEGQIQRIAIARALLSNAPILLLDECTSALDKDTEMQLMKELKKLKDRTILCVSHKDSTTNCCDRAVRLTDGKFAAEEIS